MTLSTKALADAEDLLEPDADPTRTKGEVVVDKDGSFVLILTTPLMELFVGFFGGGAADRQQCCVHGKEIKDDFFLRPTSMKKNAEAKSRKAPTTIMTMM